jgi:sugar-specific transcriptional regulator TrmB
MGQDTSEIREQIAQERAELGETVKAIAQKADVKDRIQKKASESAEQVQQKAGEVIQDVDDRIRNATPDPVLAGVQTASAKVREQPVPVLAAVVLLVVGAFVGWRLRRSR